MSAILAPAAIGAAAVTLGRGVLSAAGNGMSFVSELLRGAAGDSSGPPSTSAPSAQSLLKLRMDEMQQRIQGQLAAAGVQLMQPAELVSNGQGGIAVAGPHPQQAAIEEILGSDILLERDFNQLAGDYEELLGGLPASEMPATLTIVVPKSASGR